MNYLANVVDLEAAARSLLHFLWQGTLLAGVAFAFLRQPDPRRRYVANCLLLALMAVAPVVTYFALSDGPRAAAIVIGASGGGGAQLSQAVPTAPAAWFEPVVLLWLAGVFLFAVRAAGGWLWALHQLRRGRQPAPDAIRASVHRISQALVVRTPIRVFQSATATVPTVFGIFRPMLVLPTAIVTGMPANQLDAILAHELAHIARHDFLINCLQTLVEIALFYHPAVWWLSNTIRHDRELCCDAIAARLCGDPVTYSHALLALETTRRDFVLAATGGNLKARIQHLLRPQEPASTPAPPLIGILALTVIAAAISVNAQQQLTPYERWLSDDVVYIIAPEERTAFLRLSSEDERNEFIRQFWLRRDPTPGTERNEAKEEHYRRIAVANQRFGDSRPGWSTSRGRLYIQHGPPDEIESHPSEIREAWRYRGFADFSFTGPKMELVRFLTAIHLDAIPQPKQGELHQLLAPFVGKPFTEEVRSTIGDMVRRSYPDAEYWWKIERATGDESLALYPTRPKP